MLTRLFLNLREAALDPHCNVSSASQMSDLRFTHILDNIGSTSADEADENGLEPQNTGNAAQSSIDEYEDNRYRGDAEQPISPLDDSGVFEEYTADNCDANGVSGSSDANLHEGRV